MALTGAVTVTEDDLRPVPLSREQYDVLVAAGAFEDQRVELLEGTVVGKVPQKPIHSNYVARIAQYLVAVLLSEFADRYLVRTGLPVAAGPWSEPEPDVSVIDSVTSTDFEHPTTAHIAVEVSRSSVRRDLDIKPRVYAQAGIARYWVVDVDRREVVVHTEPFRRIMREDGSVGTEAGYRLVRRVPLDTELELLGLTIRLTDALG